MVLLIGFMDLGRIYFCSHSNQRKTNWIWFLFRHYIALFFFGNKTLNSLLWSCLLSYLFCPSAAPFILPTDPWEKVELPSELRGAKSTPGGKARWWVGEAKWLCHHPAIHMGWGMVQIMAPGRSVLVCPEITWVITLKADRIDLALLLCCLPVHLELKLVKLYREQFAPF